METKSAQTVGLMNRTTAFIRLPIRGHSYAASRQIGGRTERWMDGRADRQTGGRKGGRTDGRTDR